MLLRTSWFPWNLQKTHFPISTCTIGLNQLQTLKNPQKSVQKWIYKTKCAKNVFNFYVWHMPKLSTNVKKCINFVLKKQEFCKTTLKTAFLAFVLFFHIKITVYTTIIYTHFILQLKVYECLFFVFHLTSCITMVLYIIFIDFLTECQISSKLSLIHI